MINKGKLPNLGVVLSAQEIRQAFKDFFKSKQHEIVSSAPMVVKDDPTLMFTNAGMNQFKDIFLGNRQIKYPRIANSQKCLRVSGKHNDLEEVGYDTYHHTMFEMLGNWSFANYFKTEAISWAWEFLVGVMNIDPERLYVTVFEGSVDDNLTRDDEAAACWEKFLPKDRIINGSKKDNFWEMGEMGPCGPCSEIHIDLRENEEREQISGATLVNKDNPLVIEVWNIVFIQYNRKANGELDVLPSKHVDTGMGFERLCMAIQNKKSNYDTDVFQPLIQEISRIGNVNYGDNEKIDIALRVIADHIRTIAFSIADGQLPSNNKAGYVIRRILRRAVRYGYTFLNQRRAFMYKLVPTLIESMGEAFPELVAQSDLIMKVVKEEESTFLNTLEVGIKMLDRIVSETLKLNEKTISGKVAFELYDTFGFPLDLTELILREHHLDVNKDAFIQEMQQQKDRARNASTQETGDWQILIVDEVEEFVGYDYTHTDVRITRYREVKQKGKNCYQLVFNLTPFYAEGGGQVGDQGCISSNNETIQILDTKRENNVIIHITERLPHDLSALFHAVVDENARRQTACNHTATHLLHEALREVLGTHVEQKGSLVQPSGLRFDFTHYHKLTDEELQAVERLVNIKIRTDLKLEEFRNIPISEAKEKGATALFGEKYGDVVRAIKYGTSIELCGGIHTPSTGLIGLFKIISESSTSAGIRRIEAITSDAAELYIDDRLKLIQEIRGSLNNTQDILKAVHDLQAENSSLKKRIELFEKAALKDIKAHLLQNRIEQDGIHIISQIVEVPSINALKELCFQIKGEYAQLFIALGAKIDGKANLAVFISDELITAKALNANTIIREMSKEIQGGGGGQAFFATAGGKNTQGLQSALDKAVKFILP